MKAKIGEIWLVLIPIISYDANGDININLQKRPCLIIDDGRGLVVEQDNRNYHILKLTTQFDSYKRKLIKNWKNMGLKRKSYVRIEMPIKLEEEQLDRKVAELSEHDLLDIYSEVYKILNINALQKMSEKYERENKKEKINNWIPRLNYLGYFLYIDI